MWTRVFEAATLLYSCKEGLIKMLQKPDCEQGTNLRESLHHFDLPTKLRQFIGIGNRPSQARQLRDNQSEPPNGQL